MDHPTWPDPNDSEAWLDAAASGRLPSCPPGAIVMALRAQIGIAHRPAADALAKFLSDDVVRRLRRLIGTNHRDRGEPMIERAHYELMTAAIDPSHADHDGLVEAFAVRLRFRALDAIRVERRHDRRHPSYDANPGGLATVEANRAVGIAQTVQAPIACATFLRGPAASRCMRSPRPASRPA